MIWCEYIGTKKNFEFNYDQQRIFILKTVGQTKKWKFINIDFYCVFFWDKIKYKINAYYSLKEKKQEAIFLSLFRGCIKVGRIDTWTKSYSYISSS